MTERVKLDLRDDFAEPGPLKTQLKPADAAKQRDDAH